MEIGREAYLVQSSDKLGRSTVPETFSNISPPISVLGVPFPCDTSTQQPGQAPFWDTVFFVSPFFLTSSTCSTSCVIEACGSCLWPIHHNFQNIGIFILNKGACPFLYS